jgi:hypothetical protein
MELLTEASVVNYLCNDSIAALMDVWSEADDENLVCQRWLRDSAAKRLIFERLYGDLLNAARGLRVLDVGGGLTCFTRVLAERHPYELLDLMAHEDAAALERASAPPVGPLLHVMDWYDFEPAGAYDVVIANDVFPNVDQRLALFLDRMLPATREIRVSLTVYPEPRFYRTRRVDGEEVLCMLAWNGELTARVLGHYANRIVAPDFTLLTAENPPIFPNGRQVCLVTLRGERG